MEVIFYTSILVLFFVVKVDSNCVNNFLTSDGGHMNLDSDYNCKTYQCVPKCCGRNEVMYSNSSVYNCVNTLETKLIPNNEVTIYKEIEGKILRTAKYFTDANVTYFSNAKFVQDCQYVSVLGDKFRMFENSSLLLEDSNENISNQVSNKDYCVDTIFDETSRGFVFFVSSPFENLSSVGSRIYNGRNISVVANIRARKNITTPSRTNASIKAKVCLNDFMDIEGKRHINVTDYCKNKHCIGKCCRGTRIYYADLFHKPNKVSCDEPSKIASLTNTTVNINYAAINIYQSDIEHKVQKSNINFENLTVIINRKLGRKECASSIPLLPMEHYYILENSSLVREMPNFYKRFVHNWDMSDFCFEHIVIWGQDGKVQVPTIIYRYANMPQNSTENDANDDSEGQEEKLKAAAMLISCFFLLMVLFVYGVVHELRNLVGMVLMAYVSTLAVTFFFKAVELLSVYYESMYSPGCKRLSVFLYFTTLSSFFWMNVMSLDIWWTFRGMFKARPIHRRGELVKFGWYALYSWGVPCLVTIAVGVIDFTDLNHVPHIFKPHFEFCFYIKGDVIEMKYYLYIPIFILLMGDWVFFLMTAFNIWRIRKCMAKFANEANKYSNNQNRFGLYLKLSLVMGVSWIFEMFELPMWLQVIATSYNCLLGVAIFFIFVFKRKILFKLCQRYKGSESKANLSRISKEITQSIRLQERRATLNEREVR